MARRRRKLDKKRVAIVAGIALLCLALIVTGITYGIQFITGKMGGSDSVKLADGSRLERVILPDLKEQIHNEFKVSRLSTLKDEVATYIYNNQLNDLKEQINTYLSDNNIKSDEIAWAVQDLTTDAYIESDNATQNFTAASTYKLPLMMLWYDKIKEGSASYSDTLLYTANMKEVEDYENPTQPIVRKYRVGDSIPLENLLEAGALYSDNIAGHMLFENLGGYTAYKIMAADYSDSPQSKDFTDASVNVLNPDYTMDLAYKLYHDQGTYDDLKYWLINTATGSFLNRNGYKGYIQKIGNLDEVRNVIGYLPGEFPYSISIYSAIDKVEGEQVMADIGDICYNYFSQRYADGDYDAYPVEERVNIGQVTVTPEDPLSQIPDLPEDEIQASIIRKPSNTDTSQNNAQ